MGRSFQMFVAEEKGVSKIDYYNRSWVGLDARNENFNEIFVFL